MMKDAIKALI